MLNITRGYVGRKQRLIAADRINFNMWEISGRSSSLVPSSRVKKLKEELTA
jgi:hypothetical protein